MLVLYRCVSRDRSPKLTSLAAWLQFLLGAAEGLTADSNLAAAVRNVEGGADDLAAVTGDCGLAADPFAPATAGLSAPGDCFSPAAEGLSAL